MEFDAGDVVLILGAIYILVFAFYSGKKEFEKYEAKSEQPKEHVFKDVQIILEDGTLFQSYERILLTHFSERVYQVYTLKDGEKVFVTRFHLGENMMLMVRNSEL
jgi:predicted transcriptional regulator